MATQQDELFWKVYASTIAGLMTANAPLAPNCKIYIAATNVMGVPGGSKVPEELTNYSTYQIADYLLDPKGVGYNPNKTLTYSGALYNYVQNIKPKPGATEPGDFSNLASARERVANREKEMLAAKEKARAQFKDDDNPRKPSSFAEWAVSNASSYNQAYDALDAAVQDVETCENKIFGPGRKVLGKAKENLKTAIEGRIAVRGLNMQVSDAAIRTNADNVPDPMSFNNINTFLVPAYNIPNYSTTLSGWVANTSKTPSSYMIDLAKAQESSYSQLGHTAGGGNVTVGCPVFCFFGGRYEKSNANFSLERDSKNISITLTIKHHMTIPFQPGQWNFGLTDLVEKIDAQPPKTQPRVRPTQALFANGVGLKITFSGQAKTAFSEDYKETIGAGGGISIFGISIGASGSSENSSSTSKSSWDESSGTLTVDPTNLAYESNVLAVMGETISI